MRSHVVCISLLLLVCGCGSSNGGSDGISISISPTSVTVPTSATQQFTAKVEHTSNTDVVWQVNSVTGGSSTYGHISRTGLYTATPSVPNSASVTITAISSADSAKTATASVTIALPIAVSPSTASVEATMTQQFTATVSFSSNTTVTWQVNGVGGGNSTIGKIDSSGLYTAPNSVPTPNRVTVTAVANADNSRTASATVTITPPPIVISPTDATLAAGAQQGYTATVLSNTVQPAWSVTCGSAAPGACGSISSDGMYTAPLTPPPRAQVTISASMPDGSAETESVTATIQFSNATLTGTYVISLADDVGHAAPSHVGTLACDGSGHITGGVIDSTDVPGVPVSVTGGTYEVGTDGRGTATVQTSTASLRMQFVLSSNAKGFLVRTDSAANQASGTIDLQQSTSATAVLNGAYALAVSGVTTGSTAVLFAEAGSIRLNGTGAIITGGVVDVDTNLTLQTSNVISGAYTQPSTSGRGTLTFTTTSGSETLAYYAIDNTRVKVISIDGSVAAVGDLVLQPQGPFSNASFKGPYVFSVTGSRNANFFGVIGAFSLDGLGTVKNQQFDGLTQTTFDFNPGGYSVADPQTGRTTATWTANGGSKLQYIFYPRNDGGFVVLESDGVYGGTGIAIPQAYPSVLNLLSLGGAFALRLHGSELSTPSAGESITGRVAASTSSALFGSIDNTSIGQGVDFGLNLTSQNVAAQRYAFAISSTALGGGPVVLYRINDDEAFMIDADGTRALAGAVQRQY